MVLLSGGARQYDADVPGGMKPVHKFNIAHYNTTTREQDLELSLKNLLLKKQIHESQQPNSDKTSASAK